MSCPATDPRPVLTGLEADVLAFLTHGPASQGDIDHGLWSPTAESVAFLRAHGLLTGPCHRIELTPAGLGILALEQESAA